MAISKYYSRKIERDGMTFDSLKEYRRFRELDALEKAGQIKDLQRQVPFVLIPAQKETYERYSEKTGKRLQDSCRTVERECTYVADFVYKVPIAAKAPYIKSGWLEEERGYETVVEDTKGFKTKDYIIKRKLMLHVHGIRIRET